MANIVRQAANAVNEGVSTFNAAVKAANGLQGVINTIGGWFAPAAEAAEVVGDVVAPEIAVPLQAATAAAAIADQVQPTADQPNPADTLTPSTGDNPDIQPQNQIS